MSSPSYSEGKTVVRGEWTAGRGLHSRNPSTLGILGRSWLAAVGRAVGRKKQPPSQPGGRYCFLFVLSGCGVQKHKHMVADGAGAVFGCCALAFAFHRLSGFFFLHQL